MDSMGLQQKPHAVCIPFPAQGHINPMLKLAKLLHHKGFHITFVNTEFNHQRLLRSRGSQYSLDGLPLFRFETICDGLPLSNLDATQDTPALCESTTTKCLAPFKELLGKLNDTSSSNVPPVTCIISDRIMSFTVSVAEELGIPEVLFWTTSACGFYGYVQYPNLVERGLTPLKEPNSVVYVNFGSITVMTPDQLVEFSWGLANSKQTFLWIIRPDLVTGDSAILPAEFLEERKQRGLLASWCPQEQVLSHPSIGGFLTHSGWNSTMESILSGVPMICWPFFAEQQTSCWYCATQWGIGMEIDNNVKRDEVDSLVRELMVGEKGKEMKQKAIDWKKKAEEATSSGGSSYLNLEEMVSEVLLSPKH
ncbi:hypothetical protein LguiA_002961 [Lonicera macranthoides]